MSLKLALQTLLLAFPILGNAQERMNGLSFVAPPEEFSANPMEAIQAVKADWIAVIPYGYSYKGKSFVRFDSNRQWWGERPEGARKTIQLAKEHSLKILLKPQLYVPGSWPGDIDFNSDEEWESWEKDYTTFIMAFVRIAVEEGVEAFCIGTEFKLALQKREAYWLQLISNIRAIYSGQLTYAANWDEFFNIPNSFWNQLDFAGLDAYFPLSDDTTPEVDDLKKAWHPIKKRIAQVAREIKKPIVFTEYGYLSIDGCAGKSWVLEKEIDDRNINQQAQANAIEALFSTFNKEDWWGGGFIWKWFPLMRGHEGYLEKDYTPQGKLGEIVLKFWFSKK